MSFEVINVGGCSVKQNCELIVVKRKDKLVARCISHKITMSEPFKEKYPVASEIDHTRNSQQLSVWLESLDMDAILPHRAPMVTLIFEGQQYHYSKISGQWWDSPMLAYWNNRVFAMRDYDDDRRMRVALEYDNMLKYIVVTLNQAVVEKPIEPQTLQVYRNNDLIFSKIEKKIRV